MAAYTAGFMTHITCRLTAKNRDQLRNPTLGNRVWAAFLRLQSFLFDSYGGDVASKWCSASDCSGFTQYATR